MYREWIDRGWVITELGDLHTGLITAFFLLLHIFEIFNNKMEK